MIELTVYYQSEAGLAASLLVGGLLNDGYGVMPILRNEQDRLVEVTLPDGTIIHSLIDYTRYKGSK